MDKDIYSHFTFKPNLLTKLEAKRRTLNNENKSKEGLIKSSNSPNNRLNSEESEQKNFTFKSNIYKSLINNTFEDRLDKYREISEEKLKALKKNSSLVWDDKNQQYYFNPKLISNNEKYLKNRENREKDMEIKSKNEEEKKEQSENNYNSTSKFYSNTKSLNKSKSPQKNVYDNNFNYSQQYSQNIISKKEAQDKVFANQSNVSHVCKQSNEILSKKKTEVFKKIFVLMDTDEDGIISGVSAETKNLDQAIVNLISPIINELKIENETLNETEFSLACEHLYSMLDYYQRKELLICFDQKKLDKNQYSKSNGLFTYSNNYNETKKPNSKSKSQSKNKQNPTIKNNNNINVYKSVSELNNNNEFFHSKSQIIPNAKTDFSYLENRINYSHNYNYPKSNNNQSITKQMNVSSPNFNTNNNFNCSYLQNSDYNATEFNSSNNFLNTNSSKPLNRTLNNTLTNRKPDIELFKFITSKSTYTIK